MIEIDGRRVLHFERMIDRPIDRVCDALTVPDGLKRGVQADAGHDAAAIGDAPTIGRSVAFAPPSLWAFTGPEPAAAAKSIVRVELQPLGQARRQLALSHHLTNIQSLYDVAASWRQRLERVEAAAAGVVAPGDLARWAAPKLMDRATLI